MRIERLQRSSLQIFLLTLLLIPFLFGFFHKPTKKPPQVKIKSFKEVVGTCEGQFSTSSGNTLDVTYTIGANGLTKVSLPFRNVDVKMRLVDGALQWNDISGATVTGKIHEGAGKRIMVITSFNGDGECSFR